MKIFISWSGSRSKKMAEALYEWIPDVIQACEPWISSEDIDPGARWSSDLAKQLDQTQFGIICLTPENKNEPWIHFEAGAVSKKLDDKTRLCPYLLGLEPTDITGPLVQFQAIKADENDTMKLIKSINNALESQGLSETKVSKAFDKFWPEFDKKLKEILANSPATIEPKRPDEDKLDEILKIIREQSRILSGIEPCGYTISMSGETSLSHSNKSVFITPHEIYIKNSSRVLNVLENIGPSSFQELQDSTKLSKNELGNIIGYLKEKKVIYKDPARLYHLGPTETI